MSIPNYTTPSGAVHNYPVPCSSCGLMFQPRKRTPEIKRCSPCRKKRRAKNAARAARRAAKLAAQDG